MYVGVLIFNDSLASERKRERAGSNGHQLSNARDDDASSWSTVMSKSFQKIVNLFYLLNTTEEHRQTSKMTRKAPIELNTFD